MQSKKGYDALSNCRPDLSSEAGRRFARPILLPSIFNPVLKVSGQLEVALLTAADEPLHDVAVSCVVLALCPDRIVALARPINEYDDEPILEPCDGHEDQKIRPPSPCEQCRLGNQHRKMVAARELDIVAENRSLMPGVTQTVLAVRA